MRKVKYSNTPSSSHGGLAPLLQTIKDHRIPQLIRKTLPKRVNQAKYKYDDIILPWVMGIFCGCEKIEQITSKRKHFSIFPDMKVPSHDTIGRSMKSLGKMFLNPDQEKMISKTIFQKDIQDNLLLNELLIMVAKQIGYLTEHQEYTLHIDCTVIQTLRGESKFSYKKFFGYSPCSCAINGCPVFTSLRNGQVQAAMLLPQCLENCLKLLIKHNIKVRTVISDSAGYHRELIDVAKKFGAYIITNPKKSIAIMENIDHCNNYVPTEIRTSNAIWECEIGDTPYYMTNAKSAMKMIILKFKPKILRRKDKRKAHREFIDDRINILKERDGLKIKNVKNPNRRMGKFYDGYEYKLFVTNDFDADPEKIVKDYLNRGGFERTFDFLKNEFGWAYPPFNDLSANSIYLIINAIAIALKKGALVIYNRIYSKLRTNMTLGVFQREFIDICCQLKNRCYVFHSLTDIPYHLLM